MGASDTGVHYLDASAPEGMRIYAVGDIHGRLDLLQAMHSRIMQEILRDRPADWRIVYLGDYEDRGPDSRGVIEFLCRICERESRVIALSGNHDVGFLDYLDAGDFNGIFLHNGGVETARSYGVALNAASPRTAAAGRMELLEAMPDHHLAFLRGLSLTASFGDFFFCHAGIRPGVPLERQAADDLVWIRGKFHDHPGLHPKVIVHGHTPVAEPEILANRVNLDTGAWFSGTLTGIALEGAEKRLLQVSG